MLRYKTKLGLV